MSPSFLVKKIGTLYFLPRGKEDFISGSVSWPYGFSRELGGADLTARVDHRRTKTESLKGDTTTTTSPCLVVGYLLNVVGDKKSVKYPASWRGSYLIHAEIR